MQLCSAFASASAFAFAFAFAAAFAFGSPGQSRHLPTLCRVIVQKHEMPTHFLEEAVPHAVSLRFYVVQAFLKQIQHTGKAFICDSRDVFIQKDMFEAFNDDYLHFPRESGGYRIRGPFSQNANWITQCYGQ